MKVKKLLKKYSGEIMIRFAYSDVEDPITYIKISELFKDQHYYHDNYMLLNSKIKCYKIIPIHNIKNRPFDFLLCITIKKVNNANN